MAQQVAQGPTAVPCNLHPTALMHSSYLGLWQIVTGCAPVVSTPCYVGKIEVSILSEDRSLIYKKYILIETSNEAAGRLESITLQAGLDYEQRDDAL